MRTRLLILFCSILLKSICQPFNAYFPAAPNLSRWGYQVEQLADSSFLAWGAGIDSTSFQGLVLVSVSKAGVQTGIKAYFFGNNYFSVFNSNKALMKVSDYSSIIIGDTYFGSHRGLIILKINNHTLDTISVRYFCDSTYAYFLNCSFKESMNRYTYIGNKFTPTSSNFADRPVLFSLDSNAVFIEQQEITVLPKFFTQSATKDISTNKWYLAGNDFGPPEKRQSSIICLDSALKVAWKNTIDSAAGHPTQFANMQQKGNALYLCGSYASLLDQIGMNRYKNSIIRLNAGDGKLVWQKIYGEEHPFNFLKSIVVSQDTAITVAGSYWYSVPSSISNIDGLLIQVNKDGKFQWAKRFNNFSNEQSKVSEVFYDLKSTLNGGYIACGSPFYKNPSSIWLVRTDSLGEGAGGITLVLKEEEVKKNNPPPPPPPPDTVGLADNTWFTPSIAPSPATEVLIIRDAPGFLVKMYKVDGGIVYNKLLENNFTNELSIRHLSPGVYFVYLEKEGQVYKKKVLVMPDR